MAAERSPATGITDAGIVLRRAEPAHHPDAVCLDATALEIAQNELELVDKFCLDDNVLWPDVGLIVREEITQLEMIGKPGVLRSGSDLDESGRRLIHDTRTDSLGRRPVSDIVKTKPSSLLVRRRAEGNHLEIRERLDRITDL